MNNDLLYVGAGKSIIQLPQDVFPIKQYSGIHDELSIRVILVAGECRLALVSIEMTSIPTDAVGDFKRIIADVTDVPIDNVWLGVTHTFSAPHLIPMESVQTKEDLRIHTTLQTAISKALYEAASTASLTLTPATAGVIKGKCSININRNVCTKHGWWLGRNEEGKSEKDVSIVRFNRQDNTEPIAILFNYDVQSSIMDGSLTCKGTKLLSGDLAGEAARYIESEYHSKVVALFFIGAAGDQAPLFKACSQQLDEQGNIINSDIHEEGFMLVQQLGEYLGKTVFKHSRKIPECGSGIQVSAWRRTALCPEQEMLHSTKELRPETEYSFKPTGSFVEVPIEVFKIGEVLLIGTQPELNSGYGAVIKSLSPYENTLVMTMINGGMKYLPEEEDFRRITYTAMNTRLGRGSSEAFLKEITTLFKDLSQSC